MIDGVSIQIDARIVPTGADVAVAFAIRNVGAETCLLWEYAAVRADGSTDQLGMPCGYDLAPGAIDEFQVPLAHLDGSLGPPMVGLIIEVSRRGPGGDTDDMGEWQDRPIRRLTVTIRGLDRATGSDRPARGSVTPFGGIKMESFLRPTAPVGVVDVLPLAAKRFGALQ